MKRSLLAVALLSLLAGCVTVPYEGPSRAAMPGTGKAYDQFRADDLDCRDYARQQTGVTPGQAAVDSSVASAVLGTVLGAAAGAAIDGSRGAGAGAGAGLVLGALAGTGAAQTSGRIVQRRYDASYHQCMYGRGNRVPMASGYAHESRRAYYPPAPAYGYSAPPPPSGYSYPAPPPPAY